MINKYRILNYLFPIEDVLELKDRGKNIRCPFHKDKKPSSHIYDNSLWCFTESRFYNVTDIAKAENKSIEDMYLDLVERYGSEEALLEEFKKIEIAPKREKIVREEAETITDFADRYFSGVKK